MMVNPETIPRYAQPMDTEPPGPTCGECAYWREMAMRNRANETVHWHWACVYEIFMAKTLDELATAEIIANEPQEEACRDFREAL